jgi:hypothetical protein
MDIVTQPEDALNELIPKINPKALAEAVADPSVLGEHIVVDLFFQLHNLRESATLPNFTHANRLKYAELLLKGYRMVMASKKEAMSDRMPSISINIIGQPTYSAEADRVNVEKLVEGTTIEIESAINEAKRALPAPKSAPCGGEDEDSDFSGCTSLSLEDDMPLLDIDFSAFGDQDEF